MVSRPESDGGQTGPQVIVTHFVDLTQLALVKPDMKTLAVQGRGNTLEWPAKFRRAMRAVCQDRALPWAVPPRLMVAAVPSRGLLLLWPGAEDEARGFVVRLSPAGRRITTDLTEGFAALGMNLSQEIVIAIPVTRYLHPVHGECLALHFRAAEFLPEKSRTAAALIP